MTYRCKSWRTLPIIKRWIRHVIPVNLGNFRTAHFYTYLHFTQTFLAAAIFAHLETTSDVACNVTLFCRVKIDRIDDKSRKFANFDIFFTRQTFWYVGLSYIGAWSYELWPTVARGRLVRHDTRAGSKDCAFFLQLCTVGYQDLQRSFYFLLFLYRIAIQKYLILCQ